MRWLDSIIDSMDMSLSKLRQIVKNREVWRAALHGAAKSQTRLSEFHLQMFNAWYDKDIESRRRKEW